MQIVLLLQAKDDLEYWSKTNNKAILNRISKLMDAIIIDPYKGIGKPELLKYSLSGKWSRRIDNVNRFVYSVVGNELNVFSLRGHYK